MGKLCFEGTDWRNPWCKTWCVTNVKEYKGISLEDWCCSLPGLVLWAWHLDSSVRPMLRRFLGSLQCPASVLLKFLILNFYFVKSSLMGQWSIKNVHCHFLSPCLHITLAMPSIHRLPWTYNVWNIVIFRREEEERESRGSSGKKNKNCYILFSPSLKFF